MITRFCKSFIEFAKFLAAVGVVLGALYVVFPQIKREVDRAVNLDAWYFHADFRILDANKGSGTATNADGTVEELCGHSSLGDGHYCVDLDKNNFFFRPISGDFVVKAEDKAQAAKEVLKKYQGLRGEVVLLSSSSDQEYVPGRYEIAEKPKKKTEVYNDLALTAFESGKTKTVIKKNECLYVDDIRVAGPVNENTKYVINIYIKGSRVDCL